MSEWCLYCCWVMHHCHMQTLLPSALHRQTCLVTVENTQFTVFIFLALVVWFGLGFCFVPITYSFWTHTEIHTFNAISYFKASPNDTPQTDERSHNRVQIFTLKTFHSYRFYLTITTYASVFVAFVHEHEALLWLFCLQTIHSLLWDQWGCIPLSQSLCPNTLQTMGEEHWGVAETNCAGQVDDLSTSTYWI